MELSHSFTVTEDVCETITDTKIEIKYENQCTTVQTEKCVNVPELKCINVPRQICTIVPEQKCKNVPREVCENKCVDSWWCKECTHEQVTAVPAIINARKGGYGK